MAQAAPEGRAGAIRVGGDGTGAAHAAKTGLELVVATGERLRIGADVDSSLLRRVLEALRGTPQEAVKHTIPVAVRSRDEASRIDGTRKGELARSIERSEITKNRAFPRAALRIAKHRRKAARPLASRRVADSE